MEKSAVKVPFIHGTSGAWSELKPGVGSTILRTDPNPRAVYTAIANRRTEPSIAGFAAAATKARGGTPTIARGKMDTAKGWRPQGLSEFGRRHIGTVDDAVGLVHELDAGAVEPRRGEIWRLLQKGTGAWRNEDPSATLRATEHQAVAPPPARLKSAYDAGVIAALRHYRQSSTTPPSSYRARTPS